MRIILASLKVKTFWSNFLGAEKAIVLSVFCISENLDLNQQTFHLFRDIYFFGETFIFSVAPPSPQLAMPLSVLTASLGKNLLPLYLMSGMPILCPYWNKSLKNPLVLNVSYALQIGPRSPDYLFKPTYLIFSNPSDSCRYEMFRPPVCSCSVPGECETTKDNVLEV